MHRTELFAAASKAPPASSTVGFRLDAESRRILDARAKLHECSSGHLARQYVLEGLMAQQEREALHAVITSLQNEVVSLREDLKIAVKALLVSAGKVDPQLAETWAENNLSPN